MTEIKPFGQGLGMMNVMLNRVIPIRPVSPGLVVPALEPRLSGEATRLGPLLASLEGLARDEFGPALPRGAWLRELHLNDCEAVLCLAPELRQQGAHFAQAAFELLKRELSDTDIYVRAAAH